MSASQRNKGATFEREIVNSLKEIGVNCGRNLDQWREGGTDIELSAWMLECKRRARISVYDWMEQASKASKPKSKKPMVICRADHKEALVILRWEDMLEILKHTEGKHDNLDQQQGP